MHKLATPFEAPISLGFITPDYMDFLREHTDFGLINHAEWNGIEGVVGRARGALSPFIHMLLDRDVEMRGVYPSKIVLDVDRRTASPNRPQRISSYWHTDAARDTQSVILASDCLPTEFLVKNPKHQSREKADLRARLAREETLTGTPHLKKTGLVIHAPEPMEIVEHFGTFHRSVKNLSEETVARTLIRAFIYR